MALASHADVTMLARRARDVDHVRGDDRQSMKRFGIAPALEPEEWKHRRCGAVSIDHVDGETHVVVTDPDGELVSVSGPEEVFGLMALANDALPDGDPRKITHATVELLVALTGDTWAGHRAAEQRDALMQLARTLEALLPPASQGQG